MLVIRLPHLKIRVRLTPQPIIIPPDAAPPPLFCRQHHNPRDTQARRTDPPLDQRHGPRFAGAVQEGLSNGRRRRLVLLVRPPWVDTAFGVVDELQAVAPHAVGVLAHFAVGKDEGASSEPDFLELDTQAEDAGCTAEVRGAVRRGAGGDVKEFGGPDGRVAGQALVFQLDPVLEAGVLARKAEVDSVDFGAHGDPGPGGEAEREAGAEEGSVDFPKHFEEEELFPEAGEEGEADGGADKVGNALDGNGLILAIGEEAACVHLDNSGPCELKCILLFPRADRAQ